MMLQKHSLKPTYKDEEEILILGGKRKHPFYLVGISVEINKRFKKKISVIADNKFFAGVLEKSFANKNFDVKQHKITTDYIKALVEKTPVICHIDDNLLGDYSHASHFIVIEKATAKRFLIIDPWHGKRKWISERTLSDAISSLKDHLKMCPLLFYL